MRKARSLGKLPEGGEQCAKRCQSGLLREDTEEASRRRQDCAPTKGDSQCKETSAEERGRPKGKGTSQCKKERAEAKRRKKRHSKSFTAESMSCGARR